MNISKFLEILRITLPVFAMLALGNVLSRVKKMDESHQTFLNWLVYYISLPALIFVGMAAQPIRNLMQADFIWTTLVSMLLILIIFIVIALSMRLDRKTAVVMVFSTYWSNCAYMGFPLAQSAFGDTGFLMAAILNAVTMPILVAMTFVMVSFCSDKRQSVLKSIRDALLNPIILSSAAGILYSLGADLLGFGENGARSLPTAARELLGICETALKTVGTMGITLALIAVGGKLRFRFFGKNVLPLVLSAAGKLAILPLITLLIMRYFFPEANLAVTGSAVLLMAMPAAVTGAVIAAKFGLNEEFVSAALAVSMLGSVAAIPAWLYVVL
jgi:predicted permease